MATLIQNITNWLSTWSGSINLVLAGVLVIIGFAFVLPFKATKEFAKSALPWVLIGAGIVLGATNLANEFVDSMQFNSTDAATTTAALLFRL